MPATAGAAPQQSAAVQSDGPAADRDAASGQNAQRKTGKPWLTFKWEDHPSLRGGKKDLRLDFKARFQADFNHSDAIIDKTGLAAQDVAKKRIGVDGDLFNAVAFQIEREVSGADPWKDVFVEYHQFTFVRAQYGKFKLPFSLEGTTGATNLDFIYRSSIASQLSPGRDKGWMIHGQALDHAIGYEFGKFNHDGNHAAPSVANPDRVTGGPTVAWRLTSEPLRRLQSSISDFEVGLARTSSDVLEGFSTMNGKTLLGYTIFPSDQYVNGKRQRQGFEMRWRPGPASVKYEYIKVTEERLGEGVEDNDVSPRLLTGWYFSGTYAVTGEQKSKGLDNPLKPLFQGGIGALEAAFRVEKIRFGSVATGEGSSSPRTDIIREQGDRLLTIGVNWHPNKFVKIQLNLVKEQITDPSHGPLAGKASFWNRVFRFQFSI